MPSAPDTSVPTSLQAPEQLNALLMKQGGEPQTINLVETFGEGYSFTVEGTNGEAVAATIDANGVLSLTAGELGYSDIHIVATNASGETVTEDFRVRVAGENAYTIAVLPDTQDYSADYAPAEIFSHMTQWLVDNKDSLQIQFATHVGDVTYGNNDAQWQRAEAAMRILDGEIPYALLPGNHDLGAGGSAGDRSNDLLSEYFPVAEQSQLPGFGGVYDKEPDSYNNNYSTFTAPDGTKWLVLSLEFGPRDDVLRWAGDVIEGHLDHRVILTTHGYMAGDGRVGPVTEQLTGENAGPSYGVGNDVRGSSDGDGIWEQLVSKYPNISFTFSGHNFIDGAETQIDYGAGGQPVFQMMMNYQNGVAREATGNGDPAQGNNGGNGAIRLITIDPDNNAVYTETYFTELDDYMGGYRGKEELDRDGLTGPYRGHEETFTDVDMGTPGAVPFAKAGLDLEIDAEQGDVASVFLDASDTIVPEGASPTYTWKDADGKVVATGVSATLDLATGSHILTLEVTTPDGYVSRDEVRVTVVGESALLVDNFNDGNSNGWAPADAEKLAEFGSTEDFSLPAMADGDADVLKFPHYTTQQGLALRTNATSPTGDGLLWSYSVVMDVLIPDGEDWTALFQTQLNNNNDADLYLRNDGDGTASFGINNTYYGDFRYGEWQRVALTVERQGTSNTVVIKAYIDGQLAGTQSIDDAYRFSIYSDQGLLLFSDDNSDTSAGYVNSLLFSDRALTAEEIAGFGAADADGIATSPIAGATQFDFTDGSLSASFGDAQLTVKGSANGGSPLTVVGSVRSGEVDGEGTLKDLTNNGNNTLIWDKADARSWSDYVYDVSLSTIDNSGKVGVVFGYQDAQNHYRLTFDVNGNQRSLVKFQDGQETVLASVSRGLVMGEEVDLRVVMLDGEIRVLLDGKDIFGGPVVDADPLGSGTVGVITQTQDGATFDNIVVNRATLTAHGESMAPAFDFDGDGFATVSVTAGSSFGPDEIVSYRWLLGDQEVGTGKDAELLLPTGTKELVLEVVDGSGKISTDVVAVETVAKDQILLNEGFSADLSNWTLVNEGENGVAADWRVEDGRLVQDADVSSRQLTSDWNASAGDPWKLGWSPLGDGDYILRKGAYALYSGEGALDWKNYSIQARLTGGGNDVMGLLFYYQDPDNYYKIELDNSTGYIQLTRLVDGVESIVARTAGRYALDEALDLRVDIKDHVICAYLDGEPIFANDIEDRNHDGGSFALYNWSADGGVAYDDVCVVSLDEQAPGGPIDGTDGDDELIGTAGDDVISAGEGDDTVLALAGNDAIGGGEGDDTLDGGEGDDVLKGGDGDDALIGGAGNDILFGGEGDDALDGDDGLDTADYSDDTAGIVVDLSAGTAEGDDIGFDELTSIENVIGGAGDDVLIGSDAVNVLDGGAGNDIIDAGADDTAIGGEGDDEIEVSAETGGPASIDGGEGEDTVRLPAASVATVATLGTATGVETLLVEEGTWSVAESDYSSVMIEDGAAVTSTIALNNDDHLGIETGGTLTAGTAINWTGGGDAVIDNAGRIEASSRVLNTTSGVIGSLTFNNEGTVVGALTPQGAGHTDAIITINNAGSIESAEDGRVIDFRSFDADGASAVINNLEGGIIHKIGGDDADVIRPGVDGVVNNWGTITVDVADVDAIDFQGDAGGKVNNHAGGLIQGTKHAVTGERAVTVVNSGTMVGLNGSAVNIDNDGTEAEKVFITNNATGIMEGRSMESEDSDGDAIDIDGLTQILNYGRIAGMGAEGYHDGEPNVSEGIAIGGGSIMNYGEDAVIYGYGRAIQVDNSSNENALGATFINNDGLIQGDGHGPEGVDPEDAAQFDLRGNEAINLVGDYGDEILNQSTGRIVGGVSMGGGNDHLQSLGSFTATGGSAIDMGAGNDTVYFYQGTTVEGEVRLGTGDDLLSSSASGGFVVDAGEGDDEMYLSSMVVGGDDVLDGGAGNDRIYAGLGNDVIDGGTGNDMLAGEDGHDVMNGGEGDDVILAGLGDDTIDGGEGFDTLDLSAATGKVSVDFGKGRVSGTGIGTDSFANIEKLLFGAGDDVVSSGSGDDGIDGGAGNDTLKGGAGDDTLWGSEGDDLLDGGSGDDAVDGGVGTDTIKAGSGDDAIDAGDGNDVIDAGSGDDHVVAGAGNDTVDAGSGDDRIEGGAGDDLLAGGSGRDIFVFAAGFGRDVIEDFKTNGANADVLEFSTDVFADFDAVLAAADQVGSDTVITVDADNTVTLENVQLASLRADYFHIA